MKIQPLSDAGLSLKPFSAEDEADFQALHADPQVMQDLGGPIAAHEASEKLASYIAHWHQRGFGRWAVFQAGQFTGYVGILYHPAPSHPLGPHAEIGWRLHRGAWGQVIATRAARLALQDAATRCGLSEVFAYTAPDNLRSQAVMKRLKMVRRRELDFSESYAPVGIWHGQVWQSSYLEGGIE